MLPAFRQPRIGVTWKGTSFQHMSHREQQLYIRSFQADRSSVNVESLYSDDQLDDDFLFIDIPTRKPPEAV